MLPLAWVVAMPVKRLANEQYRQWLVELVRPHIVILITARPMKWKVPTLARIAELSGWQPQEACFAPTGWLSPPAIKKHLLTNVIFPGHGRNVGYLAIESNPRTRIMYAHFGIPCMRVDLIGDSM